MINVVLADDHILVRDGIKSLLEDQDGVCVIDEASDGKEALEVVNASNPDVLIVDIRMPEMNGIEVVAALKKSNNTVKTLVLSMHDSEEYVLNAINAGADGYLLKGSSKEEFMKALQMIASGGKYFSGDVSSIIVNSMTKNRGIPSETVEKPESIFKLTKREKQILALVLDGKSNKEIAEELDVSKRTAEVHRFNLMKKLDVKNLIELTRVASKYQLV
ncbi:two-component system response regulator, LuxR fa mily [Formosa agariphila KMM 3901]|uniref:Two-component system response regulator, LuxR fa mily n=1 Tax=Formosa agariphila (strain DSM 15362 / KCTC 12365 / LMG 23005 / KMM 3901 / M-2Alg 35-1) TaxID=1347342 RepID=T2KHT9_FORAG|nr:response regulator transcription factor [Formosa agariphila]CDF78360.1 two-component system response regulator, LuxR fa mily [Formosa agariphila KMM 3901]